MALTSSDATPPVVRLALSGRLDAVGVAQVELAFMANANRGERHLLVSLAEVEFIASLGLRMLISTARVVQRRGRRIVLYGARPQVAEVLETVAMDALLPVLVSEAEALAQLAA